MHRLRQSPRCVLWAVLAASLALCGLTATRFLAAAWARDDDTAAFAEELVGLGGVSRGVCAVLGAERDLALQIVRSSGLLVHVREPDAVAAAQLRQQADEAGLGIDRLVVEQGALDRLPYASNMVDMVVATGATEALLGRLRPDEVLRVLRPEGTAIIGTTRPAELKAQALGQWAEGAAAEGIKAWKDGHGTWVRFSKPVPEGVDDWPHWEHGPDNNPVSTDQVIRAPYLTQFYAEPFYITMPAITTAAGGRTFLATGHIAHHRREWDIANKLIARNGYNGVVLWERDLPEGYLAHRSAFVATRDTFYLIEGDGCLMLDSQTGDEQGRIRIPGLEGEWKWMAMQDGVLYVMAGERGGEAETVKGDRNFGGWGWGDLSPGYYTQPRVPWGFGHTLAAYRVKGARVLWQRREEALIDSRALAMSDGRLFLYCPDEHLRCLDAETGAVLWTNGHRRVLELIEEQGRGLVSTPGFRSECMAVATPRALVIQGQTMMNVVAVSTQDGQMLWHKTKISNNPNVIFADGGLVLGVGQGSNHVLVDPVSGSVTEELGFRKAACTRLTACPDSLFVRGEGTLRYDRASKQVFVDGSVRPGCNDGALPANGILYIGPWQCDCNLTLIGAVAKCSAGDFRFDYVATDEERLWVPPGARNEVAPLETAPADWPTYAGNNLRTGSTAVRLARPNAPAGTPPAPFWRYAPERPNVPTPPTLAGGLVFVSGQDGKVRALDARTGQMRWVFATNGPIKMPPTIWEGRAYVGSGDGHVYALEATTGRLLWRFRAAPVERQIMIYGNLCSTWPVNTGVLVADGVAYFAAGVVDCDGTYVYALDAESGKIRWQNNSCGHLNAELRKGVSAQGNLTIHGNQLLMAGGNQVNPARFDLQTGECLNQSFGQGQPKANHGKFAGVLFDKYPIVGGRILYASPENVANKDSFVVDSGRGVHPLNYGGVPPAWDDNTVALVNFRDGKLTCCDAAKVAERIEKGPTPPERPGPRFWYGLANEFQSDGAVRWTSDLGEPDEFEVVSLAVCPDSVVAVLKFQVRARAYPQWSLAALRSQDGAELWFWRHNLPSTPLPGGLLIGREGQVIVTMLDGSVLSFGPRQPPAQAG